MNPKHTSPWLDTVPDKKLFPAISKNESTEVVIIGGGIVGVMTAYQLSRSGTSVILLEKNHIGTGDTGLTTGFLTRVPETSIAHTIEEYGAPFAQKLFAAGAAAQEFIFKTIHDEKIACDWTPCKTYFGSYESGDEGLVDEVLLDEWSAIQMVEKNAALNTEFPLQEAIEFSGEGKFHSRKFLRGLLEKCTGKNLTIYEESEVTDIGVSENGVSVAVNGHTITAKKIICATGLPIAPLAELRNIVTPKLTYVLGLRYQEHAPISEDLFWDTFEPYFYYRRIDEKTIILGGCDAEKPDPEAFEKLENFAEKYFKEKHETIYQWSGSIFMSKDGIPYAFEHPHYAGKIYVATGLGGNGLVFGTCMSMRLKKMVLGEEDEYTEIFSLARTGEKIEKVPHVLKEKSSGKKEWVTIGTMSDFGGKQMLCKTIGNQKIALFKVGEKIYAMNNTCSHAGGPLCEGDLEGSVIQCPLHGAKFDVTTGEVRGLPAIRPQKTFRVQIEGENIAIECEGENTGTAAASMAAPDASSPPPPDAPSLKTLLIFTGLALIFYGLQFAYQYVFGEPPQDPITSLIRASGFSGATYFTFAILSSSIFKWNPAYSIYWRIRRYLGVGGFIFIAIHVLSATHFMFNWDPSIIYFSFNPFTNPVIFGSMAFPLFFIMAATSSDWAVTKLTPGIWKNVHRVVYFAYLASVFHFIQMNPPALKTPPGYLLLTAAALALLGQLYWFTQTVRKRGFNHLGTYVGLLVIALYIFCAYLFFTNPA